MTNTVYRLSEFFQEVYPKLQVNIPIVDFSRLTVSSPHVKFDKNTLTKAMEETKPRILLQANDILIHPNFILHVLHMETQLAVSSSCKVLRRRLDAPEGVPAYILPKMIKQSTSWEKRSFSNLVHIPNILNELVPTTADGDLPANNSKVVGILLKTQTIIEKYQRQIASLYELQATYTIPNYKGA